MLHQDVFEGVFGIPEKLTYAGYGVAAAAYMLAFRRKILSSPWLPLAAAMGLFAASIVIDLVAPHRELFEDGDEAARHRLLGGLFRVDGRGAGPALTIAGELAAIGADLDRQVAAQSDAIAALARLGREIGERETGSGETGEARNPGSARPGKRRQRSAGHDRRNVAVIGRAGIVGRRRRSGLARSDRCDNRRGTHPPVKPLAFPPDVSVIQRRRTPRGQHSKPPATRFERERRASPRHLAAVGHRRDDAVLRDRLAGGGLRPAAGGQERAAPRRRRRGTGGGIEPGAAGHRTSSRAISPCRTMPTGSRSCWSPTRT